MRKFTLLLLGWGILLIHQVQAQSNVSIEGLVRDSQSGEPLPGVTVLISSENKGTVSDESGEFSLKIAPGSYELVFSYLGYEKQIRRVNATENLKLQISLQALDMDLEEVQVLSTGYQSLPATRAAGSFAQVEEELVNRRVSTNLLDRLEDVTPGLIFNRTGDAARDPISIRGRSTLGRFNQPLIVIDNFPFDGSLEDINPNDVESMTVLRDAAAASIWGARAGNGVIVITTKSGRKDQPLRVDFNSNVNWIEPQDAFRSEDMAVSDFIGVERMLFGNGFYNATENSPNKLALTPVVETLILERDGVISEAEANQRISQLGSHDWRADLNRYLYQPQVNQQYNVGLSGGSGIQSYRFSLGYDRLDGALRGNRSERLTLNFRENFSLLDDRLKIEAAFYGVKQNGLDQNIRPNDIRLSATTPIYPYAKLADENGNPLEIVTELREGFKREAESAGLLDWAYRPLDEFGKGVTQSNRNDYRINFTLDYRVWDNLRLSGRYQYWEQNRNSENLNTLESYSTRDLVNTFTQVEESGQLSFPVPRAGILNVSNAQSSSHSGRMQLDYFKEFNQDLRWDLLLGGEVKALRGRTFAARRYGYNPELASSQSVDYFTQFSRYTNPNATVNISDVQSQGLTTDRFLSAFANSSLSYKNRYLITASLRRDASNLFGVAANMRSVPLWSAGAGWTISEEEFYNWSGMPYLRMRFSYGYNGNVDRSLTAFTTAQVINVNFLTQLNYAQIINPPNQNLRWERIAIANMGLDFETRSGNISGTLEFYSKNGLDLIGQSPFAPSTGITVFSGNNASTNTIGYDLNLTSKNLNGRLGWTTHFLISGLKEKVTSYELDIPAASLINYGVSGRGGEYYPVEDRPLFGVYSYEWGGLNPETGAPQGFLEGDLSEDYRSIINSSTLESIRYHGPARPTSFGAIRNDLSWKGFHLSVNISYRLGYFFRRRSVEYFPIMRAQGGHEDFALRWREPGDELTTQVPSMPDRLDSFRDQFYRSASHLVERGDHVRLQDIRLGYDFSGNSGIMRGVKNAQVFLYANNIGIIWKATQTDLDPDFGFNRPLRSLAAGLQLQF
ncbi:SusC/RagA family TonB-linked outer membrane protein [Algoriphagus sp.]|uniref:SusC/RagA family TonB-linked outer membrane protein n=1 Tax=Algoriphagus sp. TaxID=1872435 RepID=UPI00260908FC|nr:SusC/RagA family TonB-linked outer membrane protein [Algoriphagus sp.]